MGENINFWSTVPSICVCLCLCLSVCVWVRNINLWSTVPSRNGQKCECAKSNFERKISTLNAKFELLGTQYHPKKPCLTRQ